MFILDKPYVSSMLRETLANNRYPVLDNAMARSEAAPVLNLVEPAAFARMVLERESPRIYTNSENCIDWIAANLGVTRLPRQIDMFKDKVAFRDLVRELYPDFRYRGITLAELPDVAAEDLPYPLVLKPAIGFFSLGVHVVRDPDEWRRAVQTVHRDVDAISRQYPRQVLNTERFIVEQCIQGREFAVDVFFNATGKAVIVNIIEHLFASAKDVSDRVYVTSSAIMRQWLPRMGSLLEEIGRLAGLRNFPAHVELRVDGDDRLRFIEVNPMRFAGWCVADMAIHAFGVNPYDCYMNDAAPDWGSILDRHDGRTVGVVVADIPAHIDRTRIASVAYDRFQARFKKPLELRRIDHTEYPVFAFLFAESTDPALQEFQDVLQADLGAYIHVAE